MKLATHRARADRPEVAHATREICGPGRRRAGRVACVVACSAASLCYPPSVAFADAGHDHGGGEAASSARPGPPRFAATSELFELVGIVDGRRLRLFLDRTATNEPVKDAKLELELGGGKLVVEPRADGEFEAALTQDLDGPIAVIATVSTPQESDLLAGELVLREAPVAQIAAPGRGGKLLAGWVGSGMAALLALAWFGRRLLGRGRAAGDMP